MRRVLALLSFLALPPQAGRAMEFLPMPVAEGRTIVLAVGPIQWGDDVRFLTATRGLGQQLLLVLDSAGGNVEAADSMRALVEGRGMTVRVLADGTCASACFLLFVAARERIVERGARIGVHGASLGGQEPASSLATTTRMARLAAEYGVPDRVIVRMVTTAPRDMWWLGEDDLTAIPRTRMVEPTPVNLPARPNPREAGPSPLAAVPAAPSPSGPAGSFAQGRADWAAAESWLFAQPKAVRAGAESWIGRRSRANPGGCANPDPDFVRGCLDARTRFAPIDTRRMTDPEYRRGFSPG